MKTDAPLGRYAGIVVHGDGRGKTLGYPTANLDTSAEEAAPGIYAGVVRVAGRGPWWPATISVGDNPTFGDTAHQRIECYIHDWSGDLYGTTLEVGLIAFIRTMDTFSGVEELLLRASEDVAESRRIHARTAGEARL